ncbi:GntR family transcriptional regulator [Pisciglobus halotolerans]|uniref:DNA-binding transcriptional regulator YhcF, GntR family n=1 Tax=Pisciglobus halotolerans TaxID=745365 RepID=A0A1I3CY40_9LACT|nr:GntR family transcriptional regulator [Pisciglobus halotolerans]SFH79337.1 DNA-binding transcriptional regulator YhcF, GntR family [Pisciglobus halotolerans]
MNQTFNKREPVYVQVVRQFKEQVASGELLPGQEMPSRRELAQKLKINPNTVQRAYKEMEHEGLIYTEGNMPSKITEDQKILIKVKQELVTEAVDALVKAIKPIKVSFEEIEPLLKERFMSEK